ncbi:MAG: D-cysteine desulfhydrase family protein [Bacteroidales bacterium]|nr:MAG: D-cysteine desulfhydrase family protein [Bacteroidales bacterium]
MITNNYFELGFFPTPLHRLNRLSEHYSDYNIYIKRDDQTGLALGGNKTRKLEYLVKDAIDKGCDTLITYGAAQSNHCRQTAAAAAIAGLGCHLLLKGSATPELNGNILLDKLLGANIHWTEQPEGLLTPEELIKRVKLSGKKPYYIPIGGSNEIGSLGYARAVLELKQQLFENILDIDYIIFSSSSGGTHAGLLVGKYLYNLSSEIIGISNGKDEMGKTPLGQQIVDIANKVAALLKFDKLFTLDDVILNSDYNSAGYGVVTRAEVDALHLLAQKEGIILDPVYTGRAFVGLIDCLEKGNFKKGSNILFWHTGGAPANFHYAKQLV